MIHSVTLSPTASGSYSTMLDGKYYDKESGQYIYLLTNYGVSIEKAPVPGSGEQKWIQWFKPNNNTHVITWDDQKENGEKIAKFVKFLKRHSSVKCDGNTNIEAAPQFKLVDSRQVHVDAAGVIKTKLAVGNMIKNMKASEMMSVAFLMNAQPVGKTAEQIFVDLCDFDMGKCMMNAPDFLNKWKSNDRGHIVYAKKAVHLGIITSENNVFKFNNTTIGGTHDEIVVYLKNNPEVYANYIQKQVDERDTLPVAINEDMDVEDILDKKPKKVEIVTAKKTELEKASNREVAKNEKDKVEQKRQELIGEAIRLGVKGSQLADKGGWSIEALEKKIEAKKAEGELVAG